jgi:uncharacterized alkaline shock family protein YloU
MSDYQDPHGNTTVSPEVLVTIARLAAFSVPGVSGFAPVPGGVNRLFRRGLTEGVHIETDENVANVDLYLILKNDVNIREISRNVQQQVARALQEMVGMDVGSVNIHIEDMDFGVDEVQSA